MKRLWGYLGSLVASPLLTGLLAIVAVLGLFHPDWFFEAKSDVRIELISDVPVFDVRGQIGKLKLTYDSKDLTASGDTIRALSVVVANRGRAAARIVDFDPKFPLGVQINEGTLLEAPALSSNSAYLRDALHIISPATSSSRVLFSPVILEQDESFAMSLLILVPKEGKLSLEGLGKIAGQKGPPAIVNLTTGKEQKSFWKEVTDGPLSVQVARAFLYAFGLFVSMVLAALSILAVVFSVLTILFAPFDFLDRRRDAREQRERTNIVNAYLREKNVPFSKIRDMLMKAYVHQRRRDLTAFDFFIDALDGNVDWDKAFTLDAKSGKYIPKSEGAASALAAMHDLPELIKSNELIIGETRAFAEYLRTRGLPDRVERRPRSFSGPFYPGKAEAINFTWAPEK